MVAAPDIATRPPPRRGRSVLAIAAVLAVVIVVLVVVTIATARRDDAVERFPADTPEGTVQRYAEAVDAQDFDTAYAYFSSGVMDELSTSEFAEQTSFAVPFGGFGFPGAERRVALADVEVDGERATVRLSIEEYFDSGIPFGPSEYAYEQAIRLVLEDNEWRIDQPLAGLAPPDPFFQGPFTTP